MYRPDRIGPWPLVNLDDDVNEVNAWPPDALMSLKSVFYAVGEPTPPEQFHSETWFFSLPQEVRAESAIAFGIKITGRPLHPSKEYMLSYAGGVAFGTSSDSLVVRPIVGRTEDTGFSSGVLEKYAFVTPTELSHQRTSGAEIAPITCHMNGTCVMGDFKAASEEGLASGDLFAGFYFQNFGATDASLLHVRLTTSIHRYESDLTPFDPNR